MKNKDILNKISNEFHTIKSPDNNLEEIRFKSKINTVPDKKYKKIRLFYPIASVISLCLIISMVFFISKVNVLDNQGNTYDNNAIFDNNIVSTITIDINPSIELSLNKDDFVVATKGINEDGINLLNKIDLKKNSLENAINLILNKTNLDGYDNSAILYDIIDNRNANIQEKLKFNLNKFTENYYCNKKINNGEIIWADNIKLDTDDLNKYSDNHISNGKLKFIQSIINMDESFEFEFKDLVSKPIKELRDIKNNIKQIDDENNHSNNNQNNYGNLPLRDKIKNYIIDYILEKDPNIDKDDLQNDSLCELKKIIIDLGIKKSTFDLAITKILRENKNISYADFKKLFD